MKLLVNAPTGLQEIIEVGRGGGYFDLARVIWDERKDGPLPEITLGGMVRVNDTLVVDADLLLKDQVIRGSRTAESEAEKAKANLREIDLKSIGIIREFITVKFSTDPMLPKDDDGKPILAAYAEQAAAEQAKLMVIDQGSAS